MVDAIGEIVAAIGETVAKDSEFMNTKSENKPIIVRVLYYLVPISLLVGFYVCLLYTSPSPRDLSTSRMPSSA